MNSVYHQYFLSRETFSFFHLIQSLHNIDEILYIHFNQVLYLYFYIYIHKTFLLYFIVIFVF